MIKNSILSEGYVAYVKAKNTSLKNISEAEDYINGLLEEVESIYEGETVDFAKLIEFKNREDIKMISNINESLSDLRFDVANKKRYTLSEALEQSDAMYKTLRWEDLRPVEHVQTPEGIVDSIFGGSTELDRGTNEVDIKDTKEVTNNITKLADDEYETKIKFKELADNPKKEDKEAIKECVAKLAYYEIIREAIENGKKKPDFRNRKLRDFFNNGTNRPNGYSDEELDTAQERYNKYLEKKKAKAAENAAKAVENNLQPEETK